jgi:hypothetical protein
MLSWLCLQKRQLLRHALMCQLFANDLVSYSWEGAGTFGLIDRAIVILGDLFTFVMMSVSVFSSQIISSASIVDTRLHTFNRFRLLANFLITSTLNRVTNRIFQSLTFNCFDWIVNFSFDCK